MTELTPPRASDSAEVAAPPALQHELARERVRNARRINLMRFSTVSVFFLLFFVLGTVLRLPAWTGNLGLFAIYWTATAGVFWASRRSERIARLSSLTIALFDVPMVFLLQWATFPTSPSTSGVAGFTVAVYVALVILAALTLEDWAILTTAAVAAAFATSLQHLAGVSAGAMLSTVILLGVAAAGCSYGRQRLVALVERVERDIAGKRRAEATLRQAERMAALGALGRELSGTLDPAEVAQRTADSVTSLLKAKTAVLFRLEPASGDLVSAAATGPMAECWPPGDVLPAGAGTAGRAVAGRQAVASVDVLAEADIDMAPDLRERVARVDCRAECAVPLAVRDTVIGALVVGDVAGRIFVADERHLVQAFADHAALALDNARLYAELAARLHELQDAQEQVLRAGKLAAVGQLASGVAHEVNNPLTIILGQAQMLSGRLGNPDHERRVRMIWEGAVRAARIVGELQTFVRPQPREFEPVRLAEIASRVLGLREDGLRVNGIELERDFAPDVRAVLGDRGQIEQVLLNLVLNAEHALAGWPAPRIAVRVSEREGWAQVAVADNGPGISPDVLPRIFEPFFSTKPVGKGTGLGLSISHAIIQGHGGRVRVESTPGRGAVFFIEMPVHRGVAVAARLGDAPIVAPPGRGRVLVVDDEEYVADTLRGFLEGIGMEVNVVDGGEAAWRELNGGGFDLITLDLRMPGVSGQALYERLRIGDPATAERVIFVTGDIADDEAQAFLDRAGRPVVTKPFGLEALCQAVAQVLVPTSSDSQPPSSLAKIELAHVGAGQPSGRKAEALRGEIGGWACRPA